MRQVRVSLAANEERAIHLRGQYLRVDSSDYEVEVFTDIDENLSLTLDAGKSVKMPEPFKSFWVKNGSTANDVVLIVGFGEVIDNEISGDVSAQITKEFATDAVTVATYSILSGEYTAVVSDGETFMPIIIQNSNLSVGIVKLGQTSTTCRFELKPGESVQFNISDGLYALASGGDCVVNTIECP